MKAIALAFAVAIGAACGSFVNVVASRVPEGRSVMSPGSRCPSCMAPIAPYDNIPIVSYVLLGGRCRACRATISLRYPLVEALGALSFGLVVWKGSERAMPWPQIGFALLATVVYLAVAVVDAETKLIPRRIVYWGLALAIPSGAFVAIYTGRPGAVAVAAASALGLSGALFLIHEINPKWMGFGDVRYGLFLGWTLGMFGGKLTVVAVFIAVLVGSVVGLLSVASGRSRFGTALPFGPFLSLGAFVAMLWGDRLASLYLRLLGFSILG